MRKSNIKKLLVLLILFQATAFCGQDQDSYLFIGPKFGINLYRAFVTEEHGVTGWDRYDYKPGFSAGFLVNEILYNKLSLSQELIFNEFGSTYGSTYADGSNYHGFSDLWYLSLKPTIGFEPFINNKNALCIYTGVLVNLILTSEYRGYFKGVQSDYSNKNRNNTLSWVIGTNFDYMIKSLAIRTDFSYSINITSTDEYSYVGYGGFNLSFSILYKRIMPKKS